MREFAESLKTAVFTTNFVIEGNSPILYVFHFDDGSWQFNGEEQNLNDDDYRVISLGEILTIDSTVKELSDMPTGFEAIRKSKEEEWQLFQRIK
jgi:hypothetical protein